MKKIKMLISVMAIIYSTNLNAQNIVSPCGYSVSISYTLMAIAPSSNPCPWGYNYNVTFSYIVTIQGINTCWNGNVQIAPRVTCSSVQNDFWSLIFPAPSVGAPFSTATYTGTATTGSSPWFSSSNCATATPANMGCTGCSSNISAGPGLSTGYYSCSFATPLPIELVSFKGSCKDNVASFNWSTASESNNDYFTIERTQDAEEFLEIGTIDGANNSSESIDYSFIDNAPLKEMSYYRLKQTDLNGSFRYSDLVNVDCDSKTSEINIYPNPNSGSFNIEGAQLNSNFIVFNLLGNKIYNSKINSINTEVNIGNLSNGVYFIEISSKSETVTLKFNVVN